MGQEIQRGGQTFDAHEGLAAPFMFDNVSTDVIAPALTNLTEGLDTPAAALDPTGAPRRSRTSATTRTDRGGGTSSSIRKPTGPPRS